MGEDGLYQTTEVWVRFQQEGWHAWPEAPAQRAYLRAQHRHMFWYEVRVNVTGLSLDRSLEFHDLLDYCKKQVGGPTLGAQSCEMMATALAGGVINWVEHEQVLGYRMVTVTVSEDNECGATVVLG